MFEGVIVFLKLLQLIILGSLDHCHNALICIDLAIIGMVVIRVG